MEDPQSGFKVWGAKCIFRGAIFGCIVFLNNFSGHNKLCGGHTPVATVLEETDETVSTLSTFFKQEA